MEFTADALENRPIDFGVAVCRAFRDLPEDHAGSHLCRQLVRSATSPAANYAEAREAESRRDFIHKMQLCLKETARDIGLAAFCEPTVRVEDSHRSSCQGMQ